MYTKKLMKMWLTLSYTLNMTWLTVFYKLNVNLIYTILKTDWKLDLHYSAKPVIINLWFSHRNVHVNWTPITGLLFCFLSIALFRQFLIDTTLSRPGMNLDQFSWILGCSKTQYKTLQEQHGPVLLWIQSSFCLQYVVASLTTTYTSLQTVWKHALHNSTNHVLA